MTLSSVRYADEEWEKAVSAFSAYHRSHKHGEFGDRDYYFTAKTQPKIGDHVYVFSGDLPRKTKYIFEGRFTISQIEVAADGQRKLIFSDRHRAYVHRCINEMDWFGKDFVNRFVQVGVSPVPHEYIDIFEQIILQGSSEALDAINDLDFDTRKIEYYGTRYTRNNSVRIAALKRAAGRCECCGKLGFIQDDGSHYLETHHIISLAN